MKLDNTLLPAFLTKLCADLSMVCRQSRSGQKEFARASLKLKFAQQTCLLEFVFREVEFGY